MSRFAKICCVPFLLLTFGLVGLPMSQEFPVVQFVVAPLLILLMFVVMAGNMLRASWRERSRPSIILSLSWLSSGAITTAVVIGSLALLKENGGILYVIVFFISAIAAIALHLAIFPLIWSCTHLGCALLSKFGVVMKSDDPRILRNLSVSCFVAATYLLIGGAFGISHWVETTAFDRHQAALASAQDDASSAGSLRRLASHQDSTVRYHVARHPNTPLRTLQSLAGDPARLVKVGVLSNPQVTPAMIRSIATTLSTALYAEAFARQANTPRDVLSSFDIAEICGLQHARRALARHPNIPPAFAERLLVAEDLMVDLALAENPSCPVALLETFAQDFRNPRLLAAVSRNPSTPQRLVAAIAEGESDARSTGR